MGFLDRLFGKSNEKKIIEQILALDKEEKHQEIINLIENLSNKDKTPEIISELGRAYNNLFWKDDEDDQSNLLKAVEIFKSIEPQQKDNPKWNYRIGYSYYFLDNIELAKYHLEKGEKEKCEEFLEVVDYAIENNISIRFAELNFNPDRELYTKEEIDALEDYIEHNFGNVANVFHEVVSPDIHCDIYVINPSEDHNYYTLITVGMGAHTMNVTKPFTSPTNAELIINLPPDWDFTSQNEEDYWPMRWLKILARLPIEQDTFLGWGHTIPSGEIIEGTNFKGMLLISALDKDSKDGEPAIAKLPNDKNIFFYQIVPLYEEEMLFKLEYNAEELLDKFTEEDIPYPPVVDINRPNVCETYQAVENENLLDDVNWNFSNETYHGLMSFYEDVKKHNEKLNNNLEDFSPFGMLFLNKKIKIMYDTWVSSEEDLLDFEIVTDKKYFEKHDDNGFYRVKIVATLESTTDSFGALETLFLIHNTLSNKELGNQTLFEGFEHIGNEEDGTPLLYLLLGT